MASEVQPQVLALEGSSVRLAVNLPDCSGKNCPQFVVERLQSNFLLLIKSWIGKF
jgi:hypothetical protein